MKTNLFLILLTCSKLFAVTNFVGTAGTPSGNYFTDIQSAVDASSAGDLVLVSNGFYSTGGAVTPGYSCSNRVVISINITVRGISGPENTVILGKGPNGSNAVRGVYMLTGVLDGFTVSNGHTWASGDNYSDQSGGGVNMRSGGIVTNCIISGNSADQDGGGTYYGIVNNSTIRGNSAEDDGGGSCYGIVNNSTIRGNSAVDNGGGTCNCTVNKSKIIGNLARSFGGGAYYSTVNNCAISGNSADLGGGAYNSTINNSVVSGNSATEGGGGTRGRRINNSTISGNSAGLRGGGTSYSTVSNSIIWRNSAPVGTNFYEGEINYCCTFPLSGGTGNFTNNPVLLSSSHISASSPCIAAGANGSTIGTDIDGEPWKNPPSVGCDEVYPTNLTGDLFVDIYAKYTSTIIGVELVFKSKIDGKPVSNNWIIGNAGTFADKYFINHSFSATGEYEVILFAFNLDNSAGISATVMVNVVELNSATYYVNKINPTPIYPYNSWPAAATNIQDAVEAASQTQNSLVLVTNGIYDTGGNLTPGHSCYNRVVITKNIVVRGVNGPENTIILGKGPFGVNAVRGVLLSAGVLEGFTVSNGYTMDHFSYDDIYDNSGGGVNMYGGNGIVTNCIISGNAAYFNGGGVCYGAAYNSIVSGNSAGETSGPVNMDVRNGGGANRVIRRSPSETYGGGAFFTSMFRCSIMMNLAMYGAGAYGGTINNSTISGNSAGNYGGGTHNSTVNNCSISGNSAGYPNEFGVYVGTGNNGVDSGNSTGYGGGTSRGTVNNSTISGNTAVYGGGANQGELNNCIVWDNSASQSNNYYKSMVKYSCTYPLPPGEGNISNNPEFISVSDFHLQAISPCIDAGTNAFAPMPFDLDGNPRIIDDTVDMGCYEFVPEGGLVFSILYLVFSIFIYWRRK